MIRPLPPERRFEGMIRDVLSRIGDLEDAIIPDPDVLASDLALAAVVDSSVLTDPGAVAPAGGAPRGSASRPKSEEGFRHEQDVPAAFWSISHNLGFQPNISFFDLTGGPLLGATVRHISTMLTNVEWAIPISGFAICS